VIPADQIPKLARGGPSADRREIETALALFARARPTRPDAFRPLGEAATAVFAELKRSRRIREAG